MKGNEQKSGKTWHDLSEEELERLSEVIACMYGRQTTPTISRQIDW
jgi:hypothetical protein